MAERVNTTTKEGIAAASRLTPEQTQAALARSQAAAQRAQTRIGQTATKVLGQDTGVLTSEERRDLGYMIEAGGFAPVSEGNPWATPAGGGQPPVGGGGGTAPIVPETFTSSDGKVWSTAEGRDAWEIRLADQKLAEAQTKRERTAASAMLQSWLSTFFDPEMDRDTINALMSFVNGQVQEDVPADAIMLNIRSQPFYKQRFAANEELRKKGLAELTPAEYLQAEQSYSRTLRTAGLSELANRNTFNKLLSGEVSDLELQDRITNVYSRIDNADTALQGELGKFFNVGLSKSDLAAALLTGSEGAASLKRKVAMAEIGAEFTPRGMTSAIGVEELVNLGVTREEARRGAEYAKTGTERLTELASIYGAQTTGIQGELEAEAFKGLESQRRKRLVEQERASFAGSSGMGTPSLGRSQAGAI